MHPEGQVITGYGITTFPSFGANAYDGSKTSSANTIDAAFNGLVGNLKGLKVVPGHEFEVQTAWALLVQAEALLRAGYVGKPMGNA